MPAPVTTDSVWKEVEKRNFAVLALVTPKNEARTAGIVYTTHERQLYIGTSRSSYKARWVDGNPSVSLTVTIGQRIPFLPFVQIPAATITLHGEAEVLSLDDVPAQVIASLFRGLELDPDDDHCILRVQPKGRFLTYGIDVPLLTMRSPEKASGSAPV